MAATRPALRTHDLAGKRRHFNIVPILRHVDQALVATASLRHDAISRCTPSSRILPSVIAGPGGCLLLATVRYFLFFPNEKPEITPTTVKKRPRAPTVSCANSPLMWIDV
jgi:hypothetical protein